MTERKKTFVMVKPDGVQRGLVGEIISRFERKGLKLVGLKSTVPSMELAERHYEVHKERPFYSGLIKFITSGPVVAMVWEGIDAIDVARRLIGSTNAREAPTGTIRGDLGMDMGYNMIHGSDSDENANGEISLWFPEGLLEWAYDASKWINEN